MDWEPPSSITVKLPPARKASPEAEARAAKMPSKITHEDVIVQQRKDTLQTPQDWLEHYTNEAADALSRTIAGVPGFIGDIVTEGAKALVQTNPTLKEAYGEKVGQPHLPGFGTASQAAQGAAAKVLPNEEPVLNTAEKYGKAAVSGAAAVAPFAMPNVITGIASGVASGVGAQAGEDLFPGTEWGPFLGGLIGAGGPVAAHEVVAHGRANASLARGMQHPDYAVLRDVVVPTLEGGGTLEHPKVNPKSKASGPMQVTPETAAQPGYGIKPSNGTAADTARVGQQKLAILLDTYGDPDKALAAYNWGEGNLNKAIKKHGDNWFEHAPRETQEYVANGMDMLNKNRGVGSTGGPVPPMDPREIARAMDNQDMLDALDAQDRMDNNVVDIADARYARDYNEASKAIDQLHDQVNDLNRRIVDEGYNADLDKLEQTRQHINDEMMNYGYDSKEYDKLLEIDNMLKESIAYRGGKPRLYAPQADEGFYADGSVPPKTPANDPNAAVAQTGAAERGLREGQITPAEAREMGVPEEVISGLTPSPEGETGQATRRGLLQTLKDLWHDESGTGPNPFDSYTPDGRNGEDFTPVKKIVQAIKNARPTSMEQRTLIHNARQRQAAMLAEIQKQGGTYQEQLKALGGKLPSADYESIRHLLTDEDIKSLEAVINDHPYLRSFEKLNLHKSLHKLISPEGVKVPTMLELRNLQDLYGPDLIQAILEKQGKGLGETVKDALNVPRTVMASGDISAPARQGFFFVTRKEFWKNYPEMLKMFGSEKAYQAAMNEIRNRPTYGDMKDAGLYFADKNFMDKREEAFMSNLAEKIPVLGRFVRASDRAYSGYLNRLRADVFDTLFQKGAELGVNWHGNPKKLKALGDYLNTGTGRGSLGQFEQAATAASTIFFSPRLIASRVKLLNPFYYAKLYKADPFIARQGIRDLVGMTMVASTMLGLAKLAGAEVETDPRSTDFAKIKKGNTRLDITGGFQPYIRFMSQLITGQKKNLGGDIQDISEPGYGKATRFDVTTQFITNKLAPIPSYMAHWAQKNKYRDFDATNEAVKMLGPMYISDVVAAYKEEGATGLWTMVPSVLGVGVQTYDEPKPKKSKSKKSDTGFVTFNEGFEKMPNLEKDFSQ